MADSYNIRMDHVSLKNSAVVNNGTINNTTYNAPADNAAVLRELADAQNKLSVYAPKIADSVAELREAIEKKDQKTVRQKIAELTSGTVAEIVKGVLGAAGSRAALYYLGWG